jgi:ATP-dependent DNA ligase
MSALAGLSDEERQRELGRCAAPFAGPEGIRERGVSWVEPRLVARIGFTGWTRDGRLRHARFLGSRDDKDASEAAREAAG